MAVCDGYNGFNKCSNHITKMWYCIHPVSCAIAINAGGARSINSSFLLFLGKMNNGGINDLEALIQISTVTSCPLSADDSEPTCFFPRLAIILDGRLGAVVTPVSSTWWTRSGVNLFAPCTVSSKSNRNRNIAHSLESSLQGGAGNPKLLHSALELHDLSAHSLDRQLQVGTIPCFGGSFEPVKKYCVDLVNAL